MALTQPSPDLYEDLRWKTIPKEKASELESAAVGMPYS